MLNKLKSSQVSMYANVTSNVIGNPSRHIDYVLLKTKSRERLLHLSNWKSSVYISTNTEAFDNNKYGQQIKKHENFMQLFNAPVYKLNNYFALPISLILSRVKSFFRDKAFINQEPFFENFDCTVQPKICNFFSLGRRNFLLHQILAARGKVYKLSMGQSAGLIQRS